ncbi:MAG: hypothetical protein KDK12_03840 [Rhodobacteraceae bacterium]|nr:hypothetical protein [Paracoccaceae bacterium]
MPALPRILSAAAFSLCTLSPALAATEYRGGGFLTDFANCGTSGWAGSERILFIYAPAGLEGNSDTENRMTILAYSGAINYTFSYQPGQYPALGAWFNVRTTNVFSGGYQFDGVIMRLLDSDPREAAIGGATTFFLNFEIDNFEGFQNCTVRGRAVVALN